MPSFFGRFWTSATPLRAVRAFLAVVVLGGGLLVRFGSLPNTAAAQGVTTAALDEDWALAPSDAEPTLRIPRDLRLDLLLREPIVANPLYMTFDERGRLWVVQYRQYPWPAGLRLVSRDSVWRNVYDPPFAPPPPHAADSPFRGVDRITIHSDSDQDGTFDQTRVFLEGLNFATAALPGRGGVFVLNPPYLLFYRDTNRDDIPDEPRPQILLSGFGIEDSHSIANSLRWGPDGWIYATQGSTVSGRVATHDAAGNVDSTIPIQHSLGQNLWRYHPERHRYELFAEGGGNAFGVEIDAQGRIYSGHNGGDTRGFHYIQGGYWQKNFSKHGQLSNPFAFDFHGPMRHHAVQRFTHTFCIYDSDSLPSRYHGRLFGVNPVEHQVVLSSIEADGSSRRTHDLAVIVEPGEGDRARWFTPVDVQTGPDGALYLADWYSVQPNHYRNHEGQTNPDLGRIYRLRGDDFRPLAPFDLSQLSSTQLLDEYLFHPRRWFRETSRRILADRRDASVADRLWHLVQQRSGQEALEAFWALDVCQGLSAARFHAACQHREASVRRWSYHLLGDHPEWIQAQRDDLRRRISQETDVEVRCQIAATLRRLDADLAIPLLFEMLRDPRDVQDIYIPKTLWWSLEAHADHDELITQALATSTAWRSPYRIAGMTIPQALMRRYAMRGRQTDLAVCARLFQLAPEEADRAALLESFVQAFEGRAMPPLPDPLIEILAQSSGPYAEVLAIRRGDADVMRRIVQQVTDSRQTLADRIRWTQALGDIQAIPELAVPALRELLNRDTPPPLVNAALVALQKYPQPDLGTTLATRYSQLTAESQQVVVQVLASRANWAEALLTAIEQHEIPTEALNDDLLGRVRRFGDATWASRLQALYPLPNNDGSAREAKLQALRQLLMVGQGNPLEGRELFHGKASCGKCHRLFDRGGDLGPDLTSYNRAELNQLLLAMVHPSAEIREGYGAWGITTTDGRVLTGLKIDESAQAVVLRGTDGQQQIVPREQIDVLEGIPQSLMPEGLLDSLSDKELRDLYAFLASTTPPL